MPNFYLSTQKISRLALLLLVSWQLLACGHGDDKGVIVDSQAGARVPAPIMATQESELGIVNALASSQERGDLSAQNAIDNNPATRWASEFSDNQWLQLDFGKTVTLSRLQIVWEAAHAAHYQILISDDAQHWQLAKDVAGSQGGTENLQGLQQSARYWRIQGVKRAGPYGYSILDIHAFAGGSDDETPASGQLQAVQVQASSAEADYLAARFASDGDGTTRWASAARDGEWIQFDLGRSRAIGGLKLVWENAYAKAYTILISDDGVSWKTLHAVTNSQGGTEEFLGLAASARYVRIQAVQRATAYGVSLFEVVISAPKQELPLDPSITLAPAWEVPPADASAIPLYNQNTGVIEVIQRREADGTLVTYMGARAHERHSRERGESWYEADQMRGRYLPYPVKYFQYRTFGIEIRDNSLVKGVTQPELEFRLHNPDADHQGTTFSFFRDVNNPNVLDYGWAFNSGFSADPASDVSFCPKNQSICSRKVSENWTGNPHTALKPGDKVELSPAMRLPEPTPDGAGSRYYSAEWLYIVGEGLRPWYGVEPRLDSAPLPAETLSGGLGTVSYNYSDEAFRMFQQMMNHIDMKNAQLFVEGRRLLHTSFKTGLHSEHSDENGVYAAAVGKAQAPYNKLACIECHVMNGRSLAAVLFAPLDSMAVLTGMNDQYGKQHPHPLYGNNLQMNGKLGSAQNNAVISRYQTEQRVLAGGEVVELQKPVLYFAGHTPANYSLRAALPLIGVGLLEAIDEQTILAWADPEDKNGDGIRGVANRVYDPESGQVRLGRFGWKASKVSLRHQIASALLQDMGVTSPLYPRRSCQATPIDCQRGDGQQPGFSATDLTKLTGYLSLLAVPAQRSIKTEFPAGSVVLPEHAVNPAQIKAGQALFVSANCAACHIMSARTSKTHPFAELRDQAIRPYTDLLLHDMGPGLADNYVEAQASGKLWRTPALWGLGLSAYVQGGAANVRYLHDGRARNLNEAILWHGGEAERSRRYFEQLSASDRAAMLAFLNSL